MIIDSFCFPVKKKLERSLFEEPPILPTALHLQPVNRRYFCLFTKNLESCDSFLAEVSNSPSCGILGLIPKDLSQGDYWWQIQEQFSGFVLHPYLQDLSIDSLAALDRCISSGVIRDRPIYVCTAIGSQKLYRVSPLVVADTVAQRVSSPVVLAHAGGAKVLEALLIADANANVYLETSFSLPYWLGSSVEQDLAFAMKKLGPHRCLYGSDAPFCDEEKAIKCHHQFFENHHFDDNFIRHVMGENALRLMN